MLLAIAFALFAVLIIAWIVLPASADAEVTSIAREQVLEAESAA